jgi:hypothetical protein
LLDERSDDRFRVEPHLARIRAQEAAKKDAARKMLDLVCFDRPKRRRADFRRGRQLIQ